MARRTQESPEEARERLRDLIRTVGAQAAYEALVSVCQDPKAPAPAKATAGTSLFRAGGFFERTDEDGKKEPANMTPAEIRRAMRETQAYIRQLKGEGDATDDGVGSVFE